MRVLLQTPQPGRRLVRADPQSLPWATMVGTALGRTKPDALTTQETAQ